MEEIEFTHAWDGEFGSRKRKGVVSEEERFQA